MVVLTCSVILLVVIDLPLNKCDKQPCAKYGFGNFAHKVPKKG